MRHAIALAALFALAAVAVRNDDIYRADDVPATVLTHRYVPGSSAPDARVVEAGQFTYDIEARTGGDFLLARRSGASAPAFELRGPADHIGSVVIGVVDATRELVVWDEYRGAVAAGASFDVVGAWILDGEPQPPFSIARGPRYQAKPTVAVTRAGEVWVAWEEGSDGWGGDYRSVDGLWNNVTDARGPLHSWREVRVARIFDNGRAAELVGGVPMPSFDVARNAPDRRPGAERLGVYYERPLLTADAAGGLWLAYRHVHQAQLAKKDKTTSHVEHGFEVDLLRLTGDGWAEPLRLDQRQRDGTQTLSITATRTGLDVLCSVGRYDRRKDKQIKDIVAATIPVDASVRIDLSVLRFAPSSAHLAPSLAPRAIVRERLTCSVNDLPYTLLFGDLHRHTDLSLCFPFYDGSLDDAYRYARGPGALDFVAVTDHARDLDHGNVDGVPWQRNLAFVERHHVPGRFVAFYAFERSQGHCDHNVIALRPDVLRSHGPPLREYWDEFLPTEMITIPHATAARPGTRFCGNVWTKRDDERRPLAEVYQAFRDVDSLKELQVKALAKGQKLGFIASSDHLATSAGYACVWAAGDGESVLDRQPIFDALRARRTYGATARIELRVMCGEQWMGEELTGSGPFPISINVRGTAPIERIEIWSTGRLAETIEGTGSHLASLTWTWPGAPQDAHGWLTIRVVQEDGNLAWSSPFFASWDRAGERKY